MDRTLPLAGAVNVRDLGGLPARDGKKTRSHAFVRGASLSGLTPSDHHVLEQWGVDCVIDLRSQREAQNSPDRLSPEAAVARYHVPMLDHIQSNFSENDFTTFPASMAQMYIGLLEDSRGSFKQVFARFAEPLRRCPLFHCTAGKDRTGVTAMLLLGLGGVPRKEIVADYCLSGRFTDSLSRDGRKLGIPSYIFEAKAETIEAALDHRAQNYGGVCAYLAEIGVDADMQEAILQKLLA